MPNETKRDILCTFILYPFVSIVNNPSTRCWDSFLFFILWLLSQEDRKGGDWQSEQHQEEDRCSFFPRNRRLSKNQRSSHKRRDTYSLSLCFGFCFRIPYIFTSTCFLCIMYLLFSCFFFLLSLSLPSHLSLRHCHQQLGRLLVWKEDGNIHLPSSLFPHILTFYLFVHAMEGEQVAE